MKAKPHISVGIAGIVLVLALFATGCARPPTDEMNNAIEAVTRAETDNDAVMYASATLARAREALVRMQEEADSRRFDAARAHAADAVAIAERAIAEGRLGAERARVEAHALLSDLPPLIAETEQGMNAARDAGLDLDFDALEGALNGARVRANEAVGDYAAGRYAYALANGRNARNGLMDINQHISGAAVAVPRGK
ncbi:MAG: hypothetical protein FWD88_06310 [Treponema sp.]|nr:hypothetical protein [Treponema sp.]